MQDIQAQPVDISHSAAFNALLDDLNTPEAIAALHAASKALNKAAPQDRPRLKGILLANAEILGVLQCDPEEWFTSGRDSGLDAAAVEALINDRLEARANRDFDRADQIRDELVTAGIVLEDGSEGTTWRRR